MSFSKLLACTCVLLGAVVSSNGQFLFVEDTSSSIQAVGTENTGLRMGDLDGDGDADMVLAGELEDFDTPQTAVYLNNAGVFTEATGTGLPALTNSVIELIDAENDGDLDILISGQDDTFTRVTHLYLNNGMVFTVDPNFNPQNTDSSFGVCDIDGNGFDDVVLMVSDYPNYGVDVWMNTGGTFTLDPVSSSTSIDNGGGDVVFGDINGDGFKDVVVGGYSGLVTGHYDGTSYTWNDLEFTAALLDISLTDVDQDGDLDLVSNGGADQGAGFDLLVWINDGNGAFSPDLSLNDTYILSNLEVADLNGDGVDELVTIGLDETNSSLAFLWANQAGAFIIEEGVSLPPSGYGDIAFADVNSDQALDIIYTGVSSFDEETGEVALEVSILLNFSGSTEGGCTDPNASNYSPDATVDDGSCEYLGCTYAHACNYNAFALSDDGSCLFPGCMDAAALNYNASAGCDDGSCIIEGCTDATSSNYNAAATVDDGSCDVSGCTDNSASNYDANAVNDDGSCYWLGCIYDRATNFDPVATEDDGTCTFCPLDIDMDGFVSSPDLLAVLGAIGTVCN